MVVNHIDNNGVVLTIDTFHAKLLVEYLRSAISDKAGKDLAKKTQAFMLMCGFSVPTENIIASIQTLHSVMSRHTDTINRSGSNDEASTEPVAVEKATIH